jgi:putative membrane protein
MHWYSDHSMGLGMGFGWLFMILFWVLIIFLVVFFLKKSGLGRNETAEDILRKRYARGELSKEDFERMKTNCKEDSSRKSP